MERSIRYLAFVLVMNILCSVSGAVDAKDDLYDFCMRIERELSSNKEAAVNADVAFREAQKYMKSIFGPIPKLARAWEAVIRDEQCGKQSAEYVTIIAECNPNQRGSLVTLYAAVKRYSNQCLTAAFWDEQLHRTFESEADRSGLTKFMDARFLEQYRKDNANERPLHFATIGGPNCCKANRSHRALSAALEPILGANMREIVQTDRKRAEIALHKHLFKPCDRYLRTMDQLMWQAYMASRYHTPDPQSFVDGLSQEFKDALFRYKYCSNFRYLSNPQQKLDRINVNGF